MADVVRMDSNGFVNRHKTKKKVNPYKHKHDFKKSEQPKTNSHTNHDVATTKGMRPLMKKAGENTVHFRSCEYRSSDSPVNPEYDGRCHPHWYK